MSEQIQHNNNPDDNTFSTMHCWLHTIPWIQDMTQQGAQESENNMKGMTKGFKNERLVRIKARIRNSYYGCILKEVLSNIKASSKQMII